MLADINVDLNDLEFPKKSRQIKKPSHLSIYKSRSSVEYQLSVNWPFLQGLDWTLRKFATPKTNGKYISLLIVCPAVKWSYFAYLYPFQVFPLSSRTHTNCNFLPTSSQLVSLTNCKRTASSIRYRFRGYHAHLLDQLEGKIFRKGGTIFFARRMYWLRKFFLEHRHTHSCIEECYSTKC